MAVDCLLKILDPQRPDLLDLKDVKVFILFFLNELEISYKSWPAVCGWT